MCFARRIASVRAIPRASSSSRSRHREISSIWTGVSFFRASMPRVLLRTTAVKALTDRVRSLDMDSRAVTRIRKPWRIPSFRRGRRSFSTGNGSTAIAIRRESKASNLPTPRFFLASMRGASVTGNPWVATVPARIAP